MNDLPLQQFVKRRTKRKEKLIRASLIFACLAIAALFSLIVAWRPILAATGFGVMMGVLCFGVYLFTIVDFEFEYRYINGGLSIFRTKGSRKREKIIDVNLQDFLEFGRYEEKLDESVKSDILYDASAKGGEKDVYYATYKNKNDEIVMFLFSPDERFLNVIGGIYKR